MKLGVKRALNWSFLFARPPDLYLFSVGTADDDDNGTTAQAPTAGGDRIGEAGNSSSSHRSLLPQRPIAPVVATAEAGGAFGQWGKSSLPDLCDGKFRKARAIFLF